MIRNNIENEKQGRLWSNIPTMTYSGSIVAFVVAGVFADNVFNPLLRSGGELSTTVGKIIGVGDNRGIGLMFIVSGIMISLISLTVPWNGPIRKLQKERSRGQ